jgi:hypothetical protein
MAFRGREKSDLQKYYNCHQNKRITMDPTSPCGNPASNQFNDIIGSQTVFLRAMPRYQGVVAHDCVKVLISEGDRSTNKSVYFGKCMAFLMDSEGKQFVVIQWFTRHEANGFDRISNVPSFKLAPEAHTNSYSTLPLNAIVNGALMVPGGGRYWALLSPKEHRMYTQYFQ